MTLDPELKDWLGSYKRAHVMQSFAPTCILFISDMVQAKDDGQRLYRVGTCRAETPETPEARHRLGQLFETASEFGSPTLEERAATLEPFI